MKFEELYKKYQNGTATREERAYVENELKKAKEVAETLNKAPQIAEVGEEDIKKIKKTFRFKTMLIAGIVTCAVIVVILAVVLGVVFGISVPAAKAADNLSEIEAINIAKEALAKSQYGAFVGIDDIDYELEIESPLTDSYYRYEIEIETSYGKEVTYHVSTKDKNNCIVAHVDD